MSAKAPSNIRAKGNSRLALKNSIEKVTRSTKFQKLEYSKTKVFEVAVVATMSSGKSTFINALMGMELLPSQNTACTTRTTAILDNDLADVATAHILHENGTYDKIVNCNAEQIATYINTAENDVADVIIECSIPGVRNIKKSMLIVDTPGTNNNADSQHRTRTLAHLRAMSSGLILFVMNATQSGVNDEYQLLREVQTILSNNPALQILFVLNKADEIDLEKESLDATVRHCRDILLEAGFSSPSLFPVSSLASLLFKKALANGQFTKTERSQFISFYNYFSSSDTRFSSFAVREGVTLSEQIYIVEGTAYRYRELMAALENAGLPSIERAIESFLVRRQFTKAPKIKRPTK